MSAIEFTIHGQTYSLKNNRDIFPIKAPKGVKCPHCHHALRMITTPNAKAKAFEKSFKRQIMPESQQGLAMPVRADIQIFYPSNLQDLDESHTLDLMQKYGVIANDRQIVAKFVTKRIDPENPRVIVKVEPVHWERSGKQVSLLDDEAERPEVREAV
jgi:Holliday junction resolvase RusA-like endonuclease